MPYALILLRSLLMLGVGIVPVLFWKRRRRTPSRILGLGALAWALTVALKIAWAVPTNVHVRDFLERHLDAIVADGLFDAYVGLLTGIFEVGLVFVLARTVRRLHDLSEDDAVGFGIAFGCIEAVALALAGLRARIPGEILVASVVTGPLERVSALLVHVVCCTLLLSPSLRARAGRALGIAFVYKSIVDGVSALAVLQLGVTKSTPKLFVFEALIALLAIVPAFALFGSRRRAVPVQTLASAAR